MYINHVTCCVFRDDSIHLFKHKKSIKAHPVRLHEAMPRPADARDQYKNDLFRETKVLNPLTLYSHMTSVQLSPLCIEVFLFYLMIYQFWKMFMLLYSIWIKGKILRKTGKSYGLFRYKVAVLKTSHYKVQTVSPTSYLQNMNPATGNVVLILKPNPSPMCENCFRLLDPFIIAMKLILSYSCHNTTEGTYKCMRIRR